MSNSLYQRPVAELVRARCSWRGFVEQPVADEAKERLRSFLGQVPVGPFGTPLRFMLIEAWEPARSEMVELGTYGFVRGAKNWVFGIAPGGDRALMDYGFSFEAVVLAAVDVGLQTCWLGATFQRTLLGQVSGVREGELIPAVSPLGYGRGGRRLLDHAIRFVFNSKTRKPWSELLFHGDFAHDLSPLDTGEEYASVLESARHAPSAGNLQPWRLLKERDAHRYHLFLRRSRGIAKLPTIDLERMEMGIIMCNFELAARELGIEGSWREAAPDLGPLPERLEYVTTWCGGVPRMPVSGESLSIDGLKGEQHELEAKAVSAPR